VNRSSALGGPSWCVLHVGGLARLRCARLGLARLAEWHSPSQPRFGGVAPRGARMCSELRSSRRLVEVLGLDVGVRVTSHDTSHDPRERSTRTWSLSSEAHLSAQQPPASQEARVPSAHAYARRPVDPVLSPPQGPRQTGSLTRLVVLPAAARMTRSRDFEATVRRGRRAPGGRVVAHLAQEITSGDNQGVSDVRVGFIVSKAVGNSVTRHRVARQLRHILATHLDQLAPGSRLVIRALPGCAESTSEAIDRDVTRALRRLLEGNRPIGLSA